MTTTPMTTTTPTTPAPKPATGVAIKRYYDPIKASKDLRDYDADLSIDLMRQPGLFAYYSTMLTNAELQYDRLKAGMDILEAQLATVVRAEAAKRGDKITESQIKAAVTCDVKVVGLAKATREAKAEVGFLKGTCMAFVQRKDTLQQLAYLMREEMKGADSAVMKSSRQDNQAARMTRLKTMSPDFVVDTDEDFDLD